MQITLVQSEIEEALSDFVLARMTIKDGMELKIDLAATRGTQGFTANVDIVPKAEPVVEPLGIANKARAARTKKVVEPTVVETTKISDVVETAQAMSQEEEVARAADAMDVNEPVPSQEDPAPEAESVQEETVAPKTSLFGGLSRPVNQPTE